MDGEQLTVALAAGMLAAVNPCGFALLPAYLTLLVVSDDGRGRSAAVVRALGLTAAMTVGFVAVFAAFGLVISPIASSVQQYLPWFTLVLGLSLLAAGTWLLGGRSLPTLSWHPRGPQLSRSVPTMIGFGASYAIASLTCTIAPFLALVVTSFRAGSSWDGVRLFTVYALGMALVVGTAAVAVALAKTSFIGRMRRFGRWVPAAAGVLLLVSGGYVAYYGWWELRVLDGSDSGDPVIARAQDLRGYAVDLVDWVGAGGLAVIMAGLLLVTLALGAARQRR